MERVAFYVERNTENSWTILIHILSQLFSYELAPTIITHAYIIITIHGEHMKGIKTKKRKKQGKERQ